MLMFTFFLCIQNILHESSSLAFNCFKLPNFLLLYEIKLEILLGSQMWLQMLDKPL